MSELADEIVALIDKDALDNAVKTTINKQIAEGIKDAFRWDRELQGLIKDKLKGAVIPAIEKYDFDKHFVKLDEVLSEILEHTDLCKNNDLLSNFKYLMIEPKESTITLSQLFTAYCKYAADECETSDLEVDYTEGNPTYEAILCYAHFDIEDNHYSRAFEYATLDFYAEDQEDINYTVRLWRWVADKTEGWEIEYKAEPNIYNLAHLNEFELMLMRLARARVRLSIDGDTGKSAWLEENVTPTKEPECSWS